MSKKILIVDDEENIVKVLEARLKHTGYEVITAFDGLEGLNKAREENPDLIILDRMMPKMDGLKVCRMLKFDDNFQHIPIIFLSARGQKEDIEMGKEQKADVYISKPFVTEELLQAIKDLLPSDSDDAS